MNSQETLWFIGKCLSLAVHPERASEIQKVLQSGRLKWESLVYQSSNQLVLPALYINLKRNNLLEFLPEDLCEHFDDITNQNRKRNKAILNQVEEITTLLRSNNLEPIYLKGIAHLLDDLYEDIGERMLSDIDLILVQEDARMAWQILIDNGYNKFGVQLSEEHRHYSELIKKGAVASVEVHHRLLGGDSEQYFNWSIVKETLMDCHSMSKFKILSNKDLILHNMLNAEINDQASLMYKLLLRQSYDLMLLANRENPFNTIRVFGHYFNKLNSYIAVSANVLGFPIGLNYDNSSKIKRHIYFLKLIWKYPRTANFIGKAYFVFFRVYRYISQFFLFFFRKSTRRRIMTSLKNPEYYKAHWAMYKKWFSWK